MKGGYGLGVRLREQYLSLLADGKGLVMTRSTRVPRSL